MFLDMFIFTLFAVIVNGFIKLILNYLYNKVSNKFIIIDVIIFGLLLILINLISYITTIYNLNNYIIVIILLFSFIVLPGIYIYNKYRLIKNKGILINNTHVLLEVIIFIVSLFSASFFKNILF